ncbi:MAG: hypothetical protein P8L44_06865, partial [Opitutales bacterium]|jgi:hypothetical protein|nr:hypothetical protein [Opitutales bacterium]
MDKTELQLVDFFLSSGASDEQSKVMAKQMIKRAAQLSDERGWSDVEAMQHLLKLFVEAQQG